MNPSSVDRSTVTDDAKGGSPGRISSGAFLTMASVTFKVRSLAAAAPWGVV